MPLSTAMGTDAASSPQPPVTKVSIPVPVVSRRQRWRWLLRETSDRFFVVALALGIVLIALYDIALMSSAMR